MQGSSVRKVRAALGLTLEEMGRALMVSWVTVCRWEHGKVEKIGLLHRTILEQIADDLSSRTGRHSGRSATLYAAAARSAYRPELIFEALRQHRLRTFRVRRRG
jgi:transcriptional regulator with XRE-family HTH domain